MRTTKKITQMLLLWDRRKFFSAIVLLFLVLFGCKKQEDSAYDNESDSSSHTDSELRVISKAELIKDADGRIGLVNSNDIYYNLDRPQSLVGSFKKVKVFTGGEWKIAYVASKWLPADWNDDLDQVIIFLPEDIVYKELEKAGITRQEIKDFLLSDRVDINDCNYFALKIKEKDKERSDSYLCQRLIERLQERRRNRENQNLRE